MVVSSGVVGYPEVEVGYRVVVEVGYQVVVDSGYQEVVEVGYQEVVPPMQLLAFGGNCLTLAADETAANNSTTSCIILRILVACVSVGQVECKIYACQSLITWCHSLFGDA